MQAGERIIIGAIIGAIIIALHLLALGLADDYFTNRNIRTFLPIMGAIFGCLIGGITGALTGLIRPNSKKALLFALLISTILISIILFLKSQYLFALLNEGSSIAVIFELVYLLGFQAAFVLSVWLVAIIFKSPKNDLMN